MSPVVEISEPRCGDVCYLLKFGCTILVDVWCVGRGGSGVGVCVVLVWFSPSTLAMILPSSHLAFLPSCDLLP